MNLRRIWPLLLLMIVGAVAVADPDSLRIPFRPAARSGVVIVPDAHLRRWDPVTIFFPRSTGPAGGGPEDSPGRHLSDFPDHPGAFTWLDQRTLQFRPAEPWPPLSRLTWSAGGRTVRLNTLMAPPIETLPADGADGLEPVESITLTFTDPLDEAVLERMLRIELRDLPGVDAASARWLDADDFAVKPLPRANSEAPARYEIALDEAIRAGTRARVHFSLSVDATGEPGKTFADLVFSTAPGFRPVGLGCASRRFPLTPEGSVYAAEQAIDCGDTAPMVVVELSAEPAPLSVVDARNLLRFAPPVDNLAVQVRGRRLEVTGDFERDTLYRVRLTPAAILDSRDRPLQVDGESALSLFFPRLLGFLKLTAGEGISEREGPKRIPLEGRGVSQVDLRIHRIDPLDRGLWPFPSGGPVSVEEDTRPPGPGEAPPREPDVERTPSVSELAAAVGTLGAPLISEVIDLPASEGSSSASFGLDISDQLERISGRSAPGTYLVGVRNLDTGSTRSWMRLQVTDLSLTTVEGADEANLVVSSLSTGRPVSGATVRVEGTIREPGEPTVWATLAEGRTDRRGVYRWQPPGSDAILGRTVRRIVVTKGSDALVLNPYSPPQTYRRGQWSSDSSAWLQWGFSALEDRGEKPITLCHVFAERPVYRPDQPVHLKGFMRSRDRGELSVVRGDAALVVDGPGDLSWRYPATLSASGALYQRFDEDKRPTGTYFAWLETPEGERCGRTEFSLQDYVVPRFEVLLHGPSSAPLDQPLAVELTASYYAGGRTAGRPVRWRVSQLPYSWQPPVSRDGFLYSSDGRFARGMSETSAPSFDLSGTTDEQGRAVLPIDPTAELTAAPRTYLVEATVTGEDDQTVTTTHRVDALPPFVLGLKVPRYQERSDHIPAEILVADAQGALIEGQQVAIRLLQRQWHSHLQTGSGDFTDGAARYITDSVDVLLYEQGLTSGSAPTKMTLPIDEAGVYIVELESHDRMGRASTVSVDLFAGGDGAVSWEKPEAGVFTLQTDAEDYAPGKSAAVVLQSPFQSATALAVIEAPDGNQYRWLTVRGGQATLRLRVEEEWVPKVPVHVILMRGRISGDVISGEDLGKPTTVAASTMVNVRPVHHQLDLSLSHPERALPGERVPVTIRLSDHRGRPSAGEVTLWMVDAAVMALGRETPLDPVPSFIRAPRSWLSVRDTRNLVLGLLPWSVNPGGDEAESGADDLFERSTVRRNFDPVPYYSPAIEIPRSGTKTVQVELSDSLTTFRVRAKAVAGQQQFGHATGNISVRLPVVVQPDLPRFVRPGDQFDVTAIGRVVEGAEGDGEAQLRAEGLSVSGSARQSLALKQGEGSPAIFPVTVLDDVEQISVAVALARASDGASDAFAVTLPVRPDQREVVLRTRQTLSMGSPVALPELAGQAGARGVERSVLLTARPELLEAAAAASALVDFPYGNTESRLAKARAWLATQALSDALQFPEPTPAVQEALQWLPQVVDADGLVAFWPGGQGNVALTAWSVHFLAEAEDAGHAVDPALMRALTTSLAASLRSDYSRLLDGSSWSERTWALSALAASGRSSEAYFSEAARSVQFLDTEGIAQVLLAGALGGQINTPQTRELVDALLGRIRFRLERGEEVYDGLKDEERPSGLLLPSEVRALSEAVRALLAQQPDHPALPALSDALLQRAGTGGWGNANTDSAALMAISALLQADRRTTPELSATLSSGGQQTTLALGFGIPVARYSEARGAAAQLTVTDGAAAALVQADLRYTPTESSSVTAPRAEGFVVSRAIAVLQPGDAPTRKRRLDSGGQTISLALGDIVEEHIQLVSPASQSHVALIIPLAAGMEPLNPQLATAPPEASPDGRTTASPDYTDWRDDHVALYFDHLPQGTWDVYFRTRASTPGTFTQPPATADLIYDRAVTGNSAGASVVILR